MRITMLERAETWFLWPHKPESDHRRSRRRPTHTCALEQNFEVRQSSVTVWRDEWTKLRERLFAGDELAASFRALCFSSGDGQQVAHPAKVRQKCDLAIAD